MRESIMIEGISKDEPIVINDKGGRQSATPYGMHLIDPYFLKQFTTDMFLIAVANYMINRDKKDINIIIRMLQEKANIDDATMLLNISRVRSEATYTKGYDCQNWRLINEEEHLNHALVHYLAYIENDVQDDHLYHCFCRLMFMISTEVSDGFSYV